MAIVDQANSKSGEMAVGPRDILFECPACHKSLVVDEAGEGMIVDCPQCHINVIVPPKVGPEIPAPAPAPAPAVVQTLPEAEDTNELRQRLVSLNNKLKEMQTQRAEINNRMASRINEINRDLVLMARLETAHQQVIADLSQMITQVSAGSAPAGRTRVNLRS